MMKQPRQQPKSKEELNKFASSSPPPIHYYLSNPKALTSIRCPSCDTITVLFAKPSLGIKNRLEVSEQILDAFLTVKKTYPHKNVNEMMYQLSMLWLCFSAGECSATEFVDGLLHIIPPIPSSHIGGIGYYEDNYDYVYFDDSTYCVEVGDKVLAKYKIHRSNYYPATVNFINKTDDGNTYALIYDDGDFWSDATPEFMKVNKKKKILETSVSANALDSTSASSSSSSSNSSSSSKTTTTTNTLTKQEVMEQQLVTTALTSVETSPPKPLCNIMGSEDSGGLLSLVRRHKKEEEEKLILFVNIYM
jgi:hypothetical protein